MPSPYSPTQCLGPLSLLHPSCQGPLLGPTQHDVSHGPACTVSSPQPFPDSAAHPRTHPTHTTRTERHIHAPTHPHHQVELAMLLRDWDVLGLGQPPARRDVARATTATAAHAGAVADAGGGADEGADGALGGAAAYAATAASAATGPSAPTAGSDEAFAWLEAAAASGTPEGLWSLGWAYHTGRHGAASGGRNVSRAADLYRAAIAAADAEAYPPLALAPALGLAALSADSALEPLLGPGSVTRAAASLRRALGLSPAQLLAARLSRRGNGGGGGGGVAGTSDVTGAGGGEGADEGWALGSARRMLAAAGRHHPAQAQQRPARTQHRTAQAQHPYAETQQRPAQTQQRLLPVHSLGVGQQQLPIPQLAGRA
eukprot:364082-Chlamydomonas_euryale.AAC.1